MENTEKGSVLIISLIIMSIATALSLFIIKTTKDITESYKLILQKLEAKITAESEIEKLKFVLSTGLFKKYSVKIMNNIDNTYPDELYIDGRDQKLKEDITLSLLDLSAKANIFSYSSESDLKNLLKSIIDKNKALIVADSYLDWTDKDNLVRLAGAELAYYKNALHAKYTPRNNYFLQDIEELLNIRGVDSETYKKLKRYLSLSYSGSSLNIYLMDSTLLYSLSYLKSSTIEKIKNLKKTGRLKELEKFIEKEPFLSELVATQPSKVLEIKISVKRGEAVEKIYCIIDFNELEDYPFVIYKYKE